MELKVIKVEIEDGSERLVIEVMEDCNLWPFIILDSKNAKGERTNAARHSFFFSNQNVKARDYVLLYTKKGVNGKYENRRGSTTWEFYWGYEEDTKVWDEGDEAILVKASEYKRFDI